MKTRNKGRGPGQTQITIALDETLKKELDVWAKEDMRQRSNLVRLILSEAVKKRQESRFLQGEGTPEQSSTARAGADAVASGKRVCRQRERDGGMAAQAS